MQSIVSEGHASSRHSREVGGTGQAPNGQEIVAVERSVPESERMRAKRGASLCRSWEHPMLTGSAAKARESEPLKNATTKG
ncbi:MAG: hypothetical protein RBU37_08260 [Myxococcota bacterium]|nr:hypothetical protein [Myxococcota bacterium]